MKSSEMKKATKRILAMLLCTSMVLSSGVSASADEGMAAAQEQGHVHTEACYEKQNTGNLICTKAEVMEGHVHGDECYDTTPKLTCEQEEHSHDDGCYTTETKDVCNDESEEHTCGDACVETEEVLTCTAEEHSHNDGCYETETNLICGQEEVEAHIHNDECYAWEEKLVCTLSETAPMAEEAAAQETVKEQPKEDKKAEEAVEAEEVNLQNDDETGIKVSVKSTSDVVPEDTKVVVAPMEMDEEHETALAEAVSEFEVLGYTAYDISLKDAEDEDITLGENKVEVTIDFEELIPEGINAEEVKDVVLVHITTDEEEKLTAEAVGTVEITEEKATVEFEAESFSPYVVTYLGEAEEAVEEVVVEEPVVEDVVLTYTSEDKAYTVTVTAAPEVLENVTAFEAVPVTDEGKITALTEQLTAKAAEMQKTSLGFENYEIKFLDAEGNEVSVNGEVKVSLSFAEERIPEAATAENVDAVDAALLKTGTDDKGEAVLEEINGLVSAEAGAVKEVVYTTEAPEELILAWSGDVYRTLPNYEDDEVVITLAGTEYTLQNVVGFNVTPIKEDNEETKEQYAEVAQQLEKKIAEENEANEEEKEVVGFLAYDITLVDAEGNKLEPQGGVRVSMEYKEAAAPETVAEVEEAEVTIHHFEEDETGEVKQIVDMVAEEAVEAELTTTENTEVEKAEFVTDSFSTYTITWVVNGSGHQIIAQVVDGSGKSIEGAENIKIEKSDANIEYVFANECDNFEIGEKPYTFKRAVYTTGQLESGQDILAVRFYNKNNSEKFQYRTKEPDWRGNVEWKDFGKDTTVYLVYVEAEPLTYIHTVDHISHDITMKMFDYYIEGENESDYTSKNKASFMKIGGGWTGGAIKKGLLQNKLINGYPVTAAGDTSLAPIFGGDGDVTNGKLESAYTVNHLFSQKVYDDTGYYEYSSFNNYAYLDRTNPNEDIRNFVVYDQIGTPRKSDSDKLYNRGNFYPYNPIVAGKFSDNKCQYDEEGNPLENNKRRPLYLTQKDPVTEKTPNYYFGMSLDFRFLQPKNGFVNWKGTTSPMKYEFNGDDDLWVFIDNVLVLDLGGIHVAHKGYIDFSTGVVAWDESQLGGPANKTTTLYQLFLGAKTYPDVNNTNKFSENELKKYFRDANNDGKLDTFVNFSSHKFNMYYMERGDGASDLHVRFNLPTIESDEVTVRKEIQNYEEGAYSDVEFSFKLLDEYGNLLKKEGDKFELTKADGTKVPNVTVGANGIFKLKHNEEANFSGLQQGTKYRVQEVGVSSEEYDKVEIFADAIKNANGDNVADDSGNVISKDLEVGTDSFVVFENRCAVTNMKYLVIEKKLDGTIDGDPENKPKYQMEVKVAGQLYTGQYKLGEDYDSADKSSPTQANNGKIELEAGQVAIIMGYVSTVDEQSPSKQGIPSGTSFEVKEIELDGEVYAEPTYSVVTEKNRTEENKDYNATKVEDSASTPSVDYGAGEIVLDGNAKVIVTNALKRSLTVKKVWDSTEEHTETIKVLLKHKTDEKQDKTVELKKEINNYSVTISGLSESDYTVKELDPKNEPIEDGGNIVIGGDTYKVSYDYDPDTDGVITITNTQLAKITINKVSASDTSHGLEGAAFEIYKLNTTTNKFDKVSDGVNETDSNGSLTFDKLEKGGIYQITETVAPAGYSRLGNSIYFKVTNDLLVELTNEKGVSIKNNTTEMWRLDEASNTLTVENNCLYELPSTGGHGIYTTMLSGFALMLGAAYVWFTSRREESSNN